MFSSIIKKSCCIHLEIPSFVFQRIFLTLNALICSINVLIRFYLAAIWARMGRFWECLGQQFIVRPQFKRGRPLTIKSVRRPVSRVLSPPLRAMDGHSSGTSVAGRLARPTRKAMRKPIRGPKPPAFPIRSCSRWGLPRHARRRARGALLPHPFTLTGRPRGVSAVCFLWHFPWGHPRRTLSGTVFP